MGLPASWSTVQRWLFPPQQPYVPPPRTVPAAPKKCPEVPSLPSYKLTPPDSFWEAFPFRDLPSVPSTPVNIPALADMLRSFDHVLTAAERTRGQTVIRELLSGVDALQLFSLPGDFIPNSGSVLEHGEKFTDVLASWIKQGFVAGPFFDPPFPEFRANSMMAVQQKEKVRIIMNLSSPSGLCFNDAVDTDSLERVHMSTAKSFGFAILECGRHARLWKFDMSDAYKNLPARLEDLRLQGFSWLQAFFVETQQAFGARTAVAAFDRLGNTIMTLAICTTGIPRHLVFRTLDDVPVVTPALSPDGPRFCAEYKRICKKLNVKLAASCPQFEKSFEDSTIGTVLGIRFDTSRLTWTVSPAKRDAILSDIAFPLAGQHISLEEMQHLMGSLNDFGQMCPFLQAFRLPLNNFLAELLLDPDLPLPMPPQAQADLRVWAAVVTATVVPLPIPSRPLPPSYSALQFVSDAAGARFVKVKRKRIPCETPDVRGAASIGISESGKIWFCCRVTWPTHLLLHARDELGKAYGCKSTTLEMVGVMLPLLTVPHLLLGRELCLYVDNIAVVYGWQNKGVKNDLSASVLIRALHIIAAFLGCHVHILHLPRMSTPNARLADRLSRRQTTTFIDSRRVRTALKPSLPPALTRWLARPRLDWDLPVELLRDVQERLRREGL